MIGLGTVINVVAIVLGTVIGILFHKYIPQRLQQTVIHGIGLSVCFVGISGVIAKMVFIEDSKLQTRDTMLMVASLVIGGFIGELIDIEKWLERFGDFCKSHLMKGGKNPRFTEGFVSASLLFCVGAMAIVGSLEDGLSGNYSTLFAKSLMDGTMSIFFAATLGIGVCFSIIPVFLYQGSITLLAGIIEPYLSETLINRISLVGSVLIFAIGLNLLREKRIKVGNLLPAVIVPVFYEIIINLL